MKALTVTLAIALVAFFPLNVIAGCPTITGPFFCCGGYWYMYKFDATCAGTTGNVTNTTLWCYNTPAKAYGTGSSSAIYSYTIGASDPDLNTWSAEMDFVEWYDPNGSIFNTMTIAASVTRSGVTTSYPIVSLNGTQSRSCVLEYTFIGDVSPGDTVTVTVNTSIFNANVTAKTGLPLIFTDS